SRSCHFPTLSVRSKSWPRILTARRLIFVQARATFSAAQRQSERKKLTSALVKHSRTSKSRTFCAIRRSRSVDSAQREHIPRGRERDPRALMGGVCGRSPA